MFADNDMNSFGDDLFAENDTSSGSGHFTNADITIIAGGLLATPFIGGNDSYTSEDPYGRLRSQQSLVAKHSEEAQLACCGNSCCFILFLLATIPMGILWKAESIRVNNYVKASCTVNKNSIEITSCLLATCLNHHFASTCLHKNSNCFNVVRNTEYSKENGQSCVFDAQEKERFVLKKDAEKSLKQHPAGSTDVCFHQRGEECDAEIVYKKPDDKIYFYSFCGLSAASTFCLWCLCIQLCATTCCEKSDSANRDGIIVFDQQQVRIEQPFPLAAGYVPPNTHVQPIGGVAAGTFDEGGIGVPLLFPQSDAIR